MVRVKFERKDGKIVRECDLPFAPVVGDNIMVGPMVMRIIERTIVPMSKNTVLVCTVSILGAMTDQ